MAKGRSAKGVKAKRSTIRSRPTSRKATPAVTAPSPAQEVPTRPWGLGRLAEIAIGGVSSVLELVTPKSKARKRATRKTEEMSTVVKSAAVQPKRRGKPQAS